MPVIRSLFTTLVFATLISPAVSWNRDVHGSSLIMVGFIGDSITAYRPPGGSRTPPQVAAADLTTPNRLVLSVNEGHGGTDTTDWLPDNPRHYLRIALAAFVANHVAIVHVMLGTNDARTDRAVSPAQYRADLLVILAFLHQGHETVILSMPPYTPPVLPIFQGAADARIRAYRTEIRSLTNGRDTRLGETDAYAYFRAHISQLYDSIHPNVVGVAWLGRAWAVAIGQTLQ